MFFSTECHQLYTIIRRPSGRGRGDSVARDITAYAGRLARLEGIFHASCRNKVVGFGVSSPHFWGTNLATCLRTSIVNQYHDLAPYTLSMRRCVKFLVISEENNTLFFGRVAKITAKREKKK